MIFYGTKILSLRKTGYPDRTKGGEVLRFKGIQQEEVYLFHQGTAYHSHNFMGAHPTNRKGQQGVHFTVWAPMAEEVQVVGDFNHWQGQKMERWKNSGLWQTFLEEAQEGDCYKYQIQTQRGDTLLKADPYAFFGEVRPASASQIINRENYSWQDKEWQEKKKEDPYQRPMNIYEVHLGSWRRGLHNSLLGYRQLAHELVDYLVEMGFTHLELLPLMEHPLDASWGYQITGYYALTSRYGPPQDFKYLIDRCHQNGIGVIMDWVPGHFCQDGHGLAGFDGTPLFEYSDPRQAENKGWGTLNFDLGKPEVKSFLISNAIFWFEEYHVDGLRIDAVANMLYLDYGREVGQWTPNPYGGRENLVAIDFMKQLNETVFHYYPKALMLAEESTSWPLMTRPTYMGGLGYNYKWNMGWMNDTLKYMKMDPVHRKWHHHLLTFSLTYAFSENFVLPLSHDEVVHVKGSLINKMWGDYWQKFASLRLLYVYLYTHPGKQLLFMGGEFGQFAEWNEEYSLDWHLLEYPYHQKLHSFVQTLNFFYQQEQALWEQDHHWDGFQWIDPNNHLHNIITFLRQGFHQEDLLIIVCNFSPLVHEHYIIGVPHPGQYQEILNSDDTQYGGSGQKNREDLWAQETPWNNMPFSLSIRIPPLGGVILKRIDPERKDDD